MNLRLVWVFCVATASFMGIGTVKAQDYHQLKPADFQGQPERNSGSIAYTNCMLDFSYQPTRINNYYRLTFNIKVVMNKDKSWIDRSKITSPDMMADVLKHEQGHYIFAYLMQQEMLKMINNTRFGTNYEEQVNYIFSVVKKKYHQLNIDYDDDTNHMLDRKQQNAWDLYFRQQVNQYSSLAMAVDERRN